LAESPFQKLIKIMARLRSPQGCPWDREQTHDSLKPYLLEEAYEVLETLDPQDDQGMKEELGDLLLQIVFHSRIAEEDQRFTINDVIKGINDKLIRRHPHVFGQVEIASAEEQRIHWEQLKKKEGKPSVLSGAPKNMPALLYANRIQQKASTVGFDWKQRSQVWKKVIEELTELEQAIDSESHEAIKDEFGDLLFSMVNLSRFLDINPEDALRKAVKKFTRRFKRVEEAMAASEQPMQDASLEEMDAVWNRIKHENV